MKKKSLPFVKHSFIVIVSLVLNLSAFSQLNWTYQNTGANHTVLVQTGVAYVNGSPLEVGDYIGVFFLDGAILVCAGYGEWNGSVMSVTAWGDDSSTPAKDGFASGEAFNWKIWDASQNMEIDAFATYVLNFPNQGNYFTNGMSALATLMSSNEIIPNVTDVSCNGLADGEIDITINFGTSPYNYIWSNGATSEDLINLSFGSYSVTVTDALSVSHSLTILVNEPLELVANILVSENNAFMCQAFVQAYPFGGSYPYSFIWDDPNAQTTPLASDLCPGTYSVTITDAHNCTVDTSVVIDPNSTSVTDTAFTLLDTCFLNNNPDTAYISNLTYSASSMIIEWTIIEGANTYVLTTYYLGITTPGTYYVGLVINCPTKFIPEITLVSVLEISPSVFAISNYEKEIFSCKISPNPIDKDLRFNIRNAKSNFMKVEIYNSIGSQILETEIDLSTNNSPTIALPGLSPGIYFAKVFNEFNQNTVVKFIK
ncbi:MAG: T9SS type A sorting domain-containing protein [Bacteroidota bacterium]|nr:T9SS type A sorting domain-containing protein [Bacteroidota bacterium]